MHVVMGILKGVLLILFGLFVVGAVLTIVMSALAVFGVVTPGSALAKCVAQRKTIKGILWAMLGVVLLLFLVDWLAAHWWYATPNPIT